MAFTEEQKRRLEETARRVRQRVGSGGGLDKYISLTGAKAVVKPGDSVIVRLLPRWDIAKRWKADPKTGKAVPDPAYDESSAVEIYAEGREHWYTAPDGKWRREWCRRMLGEGEPCPLCEAAEALLASGTEEERKEGSDLEARDVFLHNVVLKRQVKVGASPTVMMGEDGRPAVKILPLSGSQWLLVRDIMLGGGASAFAYGQVFDVKEGRDLQFIRPGGTAGRVWRIVPEPNPSPLYTPGDPAWKGWMGLLHDLPAEVALDKITGYDEMYQRFYGSLPDAAARRGPTRTSAPPDVKDFVPGVEDLPADEDAAGVAGFGAADPQPDRAAVSAEVPEDFADFAFPSEGAPPAAPPAKPKPPKVAPPVATRRRR